MSVATLAGIVSAHISVTAALAVVLVRTRERLARLEAFVEIYRKNSDAKKVGSS